MFGARGPLLSPEDGTGGGGAAPAGSEGGAGAAPANGDGGKPAEKTFTQAELDTILKDRLAQDRKARAPQQAAPKSEEGNGDSKLTLASLNAKIEESNARALKAEFKSEALEAGYRKDAIDDAFALFSAQKPEDRSAWFQQKAAFFGSGGAPGSSAAGTNNGSNAQPGKPPAAAPSAPAPHEKFVDTGGTVDLYRMDPAKLEGLTGTQMRDLHERNVRTIGTSTGAPPPPRISMPQPKR